MHDMLKAMPYFNGDFEGRRSIMKGFDMSSHVCTGGLWVMKKSHSKLIKQSKKRDLSTQKLNTFHKGILQGKLQNTLQALEDAVTEDQDMSSIEFYL